ncbi:uncharacterized protein [Paramisgurnus dabryanus]|uniref:uncharacterized protein n=1 Tax=Paramisgurnus dabryanus TaxID=90735 RepID=UPI003CCF7B3E
MGNVRSLGNKMEELTALTRSQWEYRECSFMSFTETWLNERTPDTVVTLDSFHLVRADRCAVESDNDESEYRELLKNFVDWCDINFLRLNVSKTKELVVDFGRHSYHAMPVNLYESDIEIVTSYKYLGIYLNNKLDWSDNTTQIYKKVLAVVSWMMCVNLTASQGTLEVPKLSFESSVNENNIQLYTEVAFKCVIPSVPLPKSIFIGKLESSSQTPETTVPLVTSNVKRYWTHVLFFVNIQPTTDGDVVCWYKSTSNGQTSGFSNPVKLVISSLPPPKLTLHPKLFTFGGNYTVYCDSTADKATNFSMSLYYRNIPVTPNTTFIQLRSLNLTETTNKIILTQTNVNFQVEYVCTMEMLYNGKVLRSPLSNYEAAIPEELPIQL